MSGYKAECRKFQANIFNKSKCTNCFKQREEHSSDALDSNRASRAVSKCGYLFVAPDWDFTIPLYRTKRWQRRWFVLYDDGELTYSVDDLPATIPQGVIDMTRVLEVSTAEDVTGNQYSLAITAPDRVTFIKGTGREESRWWQDVLSVFPRMHKHGRHKRNATFPGIKGSSSSSASSAVAEAAHQHARAGDSTRGPSTLESPVNQRVRFHSISSDLRGARRPSSAPSLDTDFAAGPHRGYASGVGLTRGQQLQYDSVNESSNSSNNDEEDGGSNSKTSAAAVGSSSYATDVITKSNNDKNAYYSGKLSTENTSSFNDSYIANNNYSYTTSNNNNYGSNSNGPTTTTSTTTTTSSGTSSSSSTITPYSSLQYSRAMAIPAPASPLPAPSSLPHSTPAPARMARDDHKENTPPYTPEYRDNPPTSESPPTQDKQTHRLRTRRALNREARALSQPRSELLPCSVLADLEASKREEKLKDIAASITTTSSRRRPHLHHITAQSSRIAADKPTRDRDSEHGGDTNDPTDTPPPTQARGAPDGCGGADESGSSSLQRVDLPAEDLLYIKKGWLLKAADNKQDWNKYWFVLHGTGLRFYRNSSAEDTGILDGIIDLGTAKDIHVLDVARNYGFVIKTWSDKQYVFSAVTAGIRNNWVQALRNAANFKTPAAPAQSESLLKSATIESVAAERDPPTTKSLLTNNNKNCSITSSLNNSSNNRTITSDVSTNHSFSTPNGVGGLSSRSISAIDNETKNSSISVKNNNNNNDVGGRSGIALSSDDEYKTASETSATSSVSHDTGEFFDWDGSRSRNNSGQAPHTGSSPNKRRSQSSPPNSRRGTADTFPSNIDSSYGLNKNILDRYKNMQNHIRNNIPYSSSSTTALAAEDVLDCAGNKDSSSSSHHTCDGLSTCAKLSSLAVGEKDALPYRLSDSMRSLDLESSLQHDKMQQMMQQVGHKERQLADETAAMFALQQKHECEKADWRGRSQHSEQQLQQLTDSHTATILTLKSSLEASEHRVSVLTAQLEARSNGSSSRGNANTNTVDALTRENCALSRQLSECQAEVLQLRESLKSEKSEVYKWKDLVKELRSLLDGRNVDMDRKKEEVRVTRESLRAVQQEHEVTQDRLQRGIQENELLSASIRELQRQLHSQDKRASSTPSMYSSREKFSSRRHLPRLDSLSDLSNVDFSIDPELLDKEALSDEYCEVRARLERGISEIRALRRELRDSEQAHDALQLAHLRLGQDSTAQQQDAQAQLALMTDRLQDLTNKLANSEKQVRLLKTKLRSESRDRRRSSSLKGRDSFGLSRDVDHKLQQLEARVSQLMPTIDTEDQAVTQESAERGSASSPGSKQLKHTKRSKSFDDPSRAAARNRRKSLDSTASSDGVRAAIRINNLEAKVAALSPARSPTVAASPAGSPMRSPSLSRRGKSRSDRVAGGAGPARRGDSDIRAAAEQGAAEDTLSTICTQLCDCVEWLDCYQCSCGARSGLVPLHQRLSSAHQLAAGGAQLVPFSTTNPLAERMQPMTQQLVQLLQLKLSSLAERRHALKAANSWTKEAQLKNFAERIAYETVLLSQVSQALRICNQSDCNLDSVKLQDLMESHRKMAFLEKKLTNPEFDLETMAPLEFYTSMLAEKLVVTGDILSTVSSNASRPATGGRLEATCRDLQGRLLERERHLARLVTGYKEDKLHEVAVVMAQELSAGAPQDDSVLMEEVRIREAWTTAHQILVQEIVNHQTSQSLLRLTHLLNGGASEGNDLSTSAVATLSLTLCSAEAVDRIQTAAEESLRQEMEESVLTLSQKYEEVLAQYRAGDTSLINSVSATMEDVLNEFAGIMAQKALIDGHLALLQDQFDKGSLQTTQDSLIISEDTKEPIESVGDVLDSEAHLLMFLGGRDSSVESLIKPALSHAELTFLFNKISSEGSNETNNLLTQLLAQKTEVSEPSTLASSSSYRSSTRSLQQSSPIASDRDQDALELPQLRSAASLSKILPSPKTRRRSETRKGRRSSDITGMTATLGCRQCEELRLELNKLKKKLQLAEGGKQCDNCPKLLDTIERLETAQRAIVSRAESADSDEQLTELKQRLLLLEEGYEAQISQLKLQYEQALVAHPDSCDEVIRSKYQKEIEHLRGLCEKGLGDVSQHRLLTELKEQHRRDLDNLQAEKDQALAEETQATLAALDAMRKAHEAEVQKEVAKFKAEFLRQMAGSQDGSPASQRHEAEMQDIRREILSLSEKYSTKCLESANLEAKIESLNKQLGEATKSVADLETRNSRLKAQLTDRIDAIKCGPPADTEAELRMRTAEGVVKDEKLARLGTQLHKAHTSPRKDISSSSSSSSSSSNSSRGRRDRNYGDPKSSQVKN